ncbi:hypothetical protein PIB30_117911 [Stylosanthes scabra]|uniref:Uncharacterized protein n=1 Tax=Stylosanthes scabra TaxID=79078 RepID=A0ABU6VHC8_9FABA|nr:hypothetical protein [Stylosanthes scabra]
MFTISSFLVNKNNLWMRSNSHEFRITLLQRSRVVHIMPPSFAFQPFCFRPISSILYAEKLDQNILFDVLGEVIGREDPIDMVTKQGNESMRLALLVEDSEKTTISCTVFGGLVDMIQPHLDAEKYEPLIVAFQLFRAKEWNGKISIQSNFEASNVHINPNTKEAILFRESLIGSIEGETSLSTQRISHMSNKKYRAAIDDLRAGVYSIETIEDVYKAKELARNVIRNVLSLMECTSVTYAS